MNKILSFVESGRIMMAAHRGDKTRLPENTMPAFRNAIEIGSDAIEVDLHRTCDGEIVMIHDMAVDRTTDGTGRICEMTLEEVRALDAGIRYGEEFRGTKIPLFSEFLDLVAPHKNLLLNLEIKDYPEELGERAYLCADKIVEMVEQWGIADRVMINSFSGTMLKYFHEKYPGYLLHGYYPSFIMKNPPEDVYSYLTYVCLFNRVKDAEGNVVRGDGPLMSAEDFRIVKEELHCEPCVCFAADTPELMQAAAERGVSMFTCNDPERALRILEEIGLR